MSFSRFYNFNYMRKYGIYNWAAHHIFSRKTNHEFSRNYLRTSPLDDASWQSEMEFKEMFLKRNEKTCFCLSIIYMYDGLRTPRESFFFSKILNFWAWADILGWNFQGVWGIYDRTISTHFGTVSSLSMFSIIQPLFLQKTKPLYPTPKYFFGSGIWIWAAKNLISSLRVSVVRAMYYTMAIWVVKFLREGYKIGYIFHLTKVKILQGIVSSRQKLCNLLKILKIEVVKKFVPNKCCSLIFFSKDSDNFWHRKWTLNFWQNTIISFEHVDFVSLSWKFDNPYCHIMCTKGQLISKCPFDVLNFPKNQQKNLTSFCPRI